MIDSNLVIYATQPAYARLRVWLLDNATHYCAISRLETLGYRKLGHAEKQVILAVLDGLKMLMINKATLDIAIMLRQQRKMSVGDSLIAASCLEYGLPLATANGKDFIWIKELKVFNPTAGREISGLDVYE